MDRINVYLTGWKLHFKLVFTSPPMIINYFWQKEAFSLKQEVLKTLARGCPFTMNGTAEKADTSTVFEHPNPFQNEQSMKSVMEGDVIKGLTFKKWMTTVVLWFVRLVKIPKHWKLIFEIFHTLSCHSKYSYAIGQRQGIGSKSFPVYAAFSTGIIRAPIFDLEKSRYLFLGLG